MADDLNRKLQAQLEQLRKDVDRLQRTNPLEAASVTSGRVRFIGGLLRVDSGGSVEIVGTLAIDGTTTVTGSFTVTGPWGLEGDGTITGDVTITGIVDISGTVNLTGDMNVIGGGRIKAGNIEINPSESGGSIKVAGHSIFVSGEVLTIQHAGGNQVVLNAGTVGIVAGGNSVSVSGTGITGTFPKSTSAGIPPGCIYRKGDGFLYEG